MPSSPDTSRQIRRSHGIRVRRFAGTARLARNLGRPLRIAHLTDLHVGRVTPMEVQRAAVEAANAQSPDLVVLTGDFVCHSLEYLDALEDVLRGIRAPMLAVLGNHDHWSGAQEVRRTLRRVGAEVLDNACTVVAIQGERLQVVGLDDAYTGHADVGRAVRGLRADLPSIGLSHIAEEADALWQRGVSLVLSGHTHSGHVTWGRFHHLTLAGIAGHRYVHGLYGCRMERSAAGAVYVGAGIGAAVFGLRLGERAQREVALFDAGVLPGTFEEPHVEQPHFPGRAVSDIKLARRIARVEAKRMRREQGSG